MDKREQLQNMGILVGLEDALAIFEYLRSDFKDEALKESLQESADMMAQAVKDRAPVLTGNIKSKVTTKILRTINNGTAKAILVGVSLEGKRGKSSDPNRSAYYALPVEKGYMAGVREVRAKADTLKEYTTKSGRKYTRGSASRAAKYSDGSVYVAPNPFMQPAFDATAGKVAPIFAEVFDRKVKQLSSRNLKRWGSK